MPHIVYLTPGQYSELLRKGINPEEFYGDSTVIIRDKTEDTRDTDDQSREDYIFPLDEAISRALGGEDSDKYRPFNVGEFLDSLTGSTKESASNKQPEPETPCEDCDCEKSGDSTEENYVAHFLSSVFGLDVDEVRQALNGQALNDGTVSVDFPDEAQEDEYDDSKENDSALTDEVAQLLGDIFDEFTPDDEQHYPSAPEPEDKQDENKADGFKLKISITFKRS